MNNDASFKVLRWKWDIQDFDFDIEHISGATNIAADLFSRLCVLQTTDEIVSSVEQHESTLKEFSKPSYLFALAATRKVGPLKPWMKDNRPIQEDVYKLIQSVCGATGWIYMIYMVFSLFTSTIQFPYAYTGTNGFVQRLHGFAVTGSP